MQQNDPTQAFDALVSKILQRHAPTLSDKIQQALQRDLRAAVATQVSTHMQQTNAQNQAQRLVIGANGRNRRGIVAGLTQAMTDMGADICDISQTIVNDCFTMMIVVQMPDDFAQEAAFSDCREELKKVGAELGVHVVVFSEALLRAMHSV